MRCVSRIVLFCFLGLVGTQAAWAQLTVSSGAMLFVQTGSTPPPTQTLNVSAPGVVTFGFTAVATTTTGGSWLTVSGAGTGPAALTVTANGSGLAPGTYHGSILITAATVTGSPKTVTVDLRVLAIGTGAIVARPDELEFHSAVGGPAPPSKPITVSNPMTASFAWTAVAQVTTPSGGNWLSVTPASGTGTTVIDVSVNPAGLARGEYKGKVILTSGSTTATVEVEFEVGEDDDDREGGNRNPAMRLEPPSIHFQFESNTAAARTRDLQVNVQGSSVNWTTSVLVETPSGGTWPSVSPASGSGQGKIHVTGNPAGLSPGLYSGKVIVNGGAAGSDETRVFLRVEGPQRPRVRVSPRSVQFSFSLATHVATPGSRAIQISSEASGLTFTASATTAAGGNWLAITPASGALPGTITASINATVANTLAVGTYTGNIQINTPGASQTVHNVHVALRVLSATQPPKLEVEPGGLLFSATAGGSNPASKNVKLEAEGAASIAWTAAASTAVGGNWLSVLPASGTVTAGSSSNVAVSVNISGLTPGVYGGAVVFTPAPASGATIFTMLVKLVVHSSTGASMTTMSVNNTAEASATPAVAVIAYPPQGFTAQVGLPVNVSVSVFDTNGSPVTGAAVIARSSGSEPILTLDDMGGGQFEGIFRPLATGPLTLTVEVEGQTTVRDSVSSIVAAQSANAIFQGGVVSAASFARAPSPLGLGSLASVFGLKIAGSTTAASRIPLPTSMAGVSVTVGGVPAPLLALSAGTTSDQINIQIPFELSGISQAEVVVSNNGQITAAERVFLGTAPALFTMSQDGSGVGAILHADFSPVTPSRPVVPGEMILLFGTGFGEVSPPAASGAATQGLSRVNAPVRATISGVDAPVLFAGLAPGFVGLYQVNVMVPAGLISGDQRVNVTVGGVSATGRTTVGMR